MFDLSHLTVYVLGDDLWSFQNQMKDLLSGVADQRTFCDLLNNPLFR